LGIKVGKKSLKSEGLKSESLKSRQALIPFTPSLLHQFTNSPLNPFPPIKRVPDLKTRSGTRLIAAVLIAAELFKRQVLLKVYGKSQL
jgi:hypothetical protein